MTHSDLHTKLSELLYIEDHAMYDIIMASIVANAKQIGDPVWLTLIGPSSGGKSQIIRPFAKGNPDFIHRVDDLTPNTFLSGQLGAEKSLLGIMGDFGIISMDDLTVLFSKNNEARNEILSQFRMLYDGRLAKATGGHQGEMTWEGYLGMIAGSTPAIYRFFSEVADMGERFVIYRMKPFDDEKALAHIDNNPMSTKERDEKLGAVISEYLRGIMAIDNPELLGLDEEIQDEISFFARHCAHLRTAVHVDERNYHVDEFPEPEMPMRVKNQLRPLAIALQIVRQEKLTKDTVKDLLWVAYSLSNDKRRAFLRAAVGLDYYGKEITKKTLGMAVKFHPEIAGQAISQLYALDIIRPHDMKEDVYVLNRLELREVVNRLDPPPESLQDISVQW